MKQPGRLKRLWIRLCRSPHSGGFGIQSPWAFAFVREVVNEHCPYYAYSELRQRYRKTKPVERKLAELYFRIANWRRPTLIVDYGESMPAYAAYMKRGCLRARVIKIGGCAVSHEQLSSLGHIDMVRLAAGSGAAQFVDALLKVADSRMVLAVEGIKSSKEARELWERIVGSELTGVSFDLYYCGLVFFDRKMYKQSYVVNF